MARQNTYPYEGSTTDAKVMSSLIPMLLDYLDHPSVDIPALEVIRDVQEMIRDESLSVPVADGIVKESLKFVHKIHEPEHTMNLRDDMIISALILLVRSSVSRDRFLTTVFRQASALTFECSYVGYKWITEKDRQLYNEISHFAVFYTRGMDAIACLEEFRHSGLYSMEMLLSLSGLAADAFAGKFCSPDLRKVAGIVIDYELNLLSLGETNRVIILRRALAMTMTVMKASDPSIEYDGFGEASAKDMFDLQKLAEDEGLNFSERGP